MSFRATYSLQQSVVIRGAACAALACVCCLNGAGAALVLNLDASDVSALNGGTIADGDAVSSWGQTFGETAGIALSQSNANKQPIYDADGLNGRPTVRFDGVDDVLAERWGNAIDNDEWTFLLVAQTLDTSKQFQVPFSHPVGNAPGGMNIIYYRDNFAWHMVFTSAPSGPTNNFVAMPTETVSGQAGGLGEVALRGFSADGTDIVGHYNELTNLTDGATSGGTLWSRDNAFAYIGARNTEDRHFVGNISQIVAFDEQLTGPTLANLQQALSEKWSLGVDFGGDARAGSLLLEPVPEPSSLLLALGGCLTAIGVARSRSWQR